MSRGRGVTSNGRSKVRPFVKLPWDVYDVLEAKDVSPPGRVVLFHLIRIHNGSNNGKLSFAVRTGAKLGLSRTTTSRAIHELIDAGFVTAEAPSSFNLKVGKAAEYGLAWLPINGQTPTLGYRDIPQSEIKHGPARRTDSPARGTEEGRKTA